MTNDMNFDKIRYIQLLKKAETLKDEGTSLFDQNHDEDLELLSYQVRLESQIY
jgi:hypothetical protein